MMHFIFSYQQSAASIMQPIQPAKYRRSEWSTSWKRFLYEHTKFRFERIRIYC